MDNVSKMSEVVRFCATSLLFYPPVEGTTKQKEES